MRITRRPCVERVFVENGQMLGLFRQELMRFVARPELQYLVPDAQRAHFLFSEIAIGGSIPGNVCDGRYEQGCEGEDIHRSTISG